MRSTTPRTALWALCVALIVVLGGCGRNDGVMTVEHVPALPSGASPLVANEWSRIDGQPLGDREIDVYQGHPHCEGWETLVFLNVHREPTAPTSDWLQLVRDVNGVLPQELLQGAVHLDAAVPPKAVDSGYRAGVVELWLDDGDPDAAYLRFEDRVERWPRVMPVAMCA